MNLQIRIATPFDYDDRDPRAKMIRETSAFLSLVLGNPELLDQMPSLPRHRVGEPGKVWTKGFSWLYYSKLNEYLNKLES